MIPRDTIEKIYAAAHIEDVVGDYVTLRKKGANYWGLCPFHDEKTSSFSVSPAKGIFKCFGCGKAGNAVGFVMEMEQCSYPDALRHLAKRYHIEVQEQEMTPEEKARENERESLFKVNEWARDWFEKQLHETEEGQNIGLSYFIGRGLSEDIIRKFQLGYSPEKSKLYIAATKAGYKEEFLEKTGLCGKSDRGLYDRFRDRVIFPIFTVSGKVVAFAGRILKKKDNVGKYVNSPDSTIYSKQNELYGLFQAKQSIAKQNCCYLVEGQMDVLSMHQAGIPNVVCSGGTALTKNQVRLIHRFTENVNLIYDGDAAGIHAALRGIDILLEEGLNIKVVLLPDGEDPDSFSRKMNANEFIEFINSNKQDFIRFKTKLLLADVASDPIRKAEVVRSIVESIAVIPDLLKRQIYIKDCSTLLDMREDTLLKEMEKSRRKRYSTDKTATTEEEMPSPQTETVEVVEKHISNIPQKTVSSRFANNTLNILQILIRYGERTYAEYDDGSACSVGEFIINELKGDKTQFDNPLYQQIVDEYAEHMADENFVPEQYFKYHSDTRVSNLAIHLISDQYELSKMHGRKSVTENVMTAVKIETDADRLDELVPQLLYELKLTVHLQRIEEIKLQIKQAEENDSPELLTLLKKYKKMEKIRLQLCQILGQRFN